MYILCQIMGILWRNHQYIVFAKILRRHLENNLYGDGLMQNTEEPVIYTHNNNFFNN